MIAATLGSFTPMRALSMGLRRYDMFFPAHIRHLSGAPRS